MSNRQLIVPLLGVDQNEGVESKLDGDLATGANTTLSGGGGESEADATIDVNIFESPTTGTTNDDTSSKNLVGAIMAYKKLARFVGWVDTLTKNRLFFLIYQIFLWALLVFELYAGYFAKYRPSNMGTAASSGNNTDLTNQTGITNNTANNTGISDAAKYYLVGQLVTNFMPFFVLPIVFSFYFHFRRTRPRICTMDSTLLDDAFNTVTSTRWVYARTHAPMSLNGRAPYHCVIPNPKRVSSLPHSLDTRLSRRTSTTTYRDFKAIAQKPLYLLRSTFWAAVVFFGPLYLATIGAQLAAHPFLSLRTGLTLLVAQAQTSYLSITYIVTEYLTAVACAAYEYEHAYAEAGLHIRKHSESSAKREDDEDVRRDRAISHEHSMQEAQILQNYREHYLDARNAIAKQNSYYALPIGFMLILMAASMVFRFVHMFSVGSVAAGFQGMLRGIPLFAVVFPTAYANFQVDAFAGYILEDSAYTFEFAIKYSACELHSTPATHHACAQTHTVGLCLSRPLYPSRPLGLSVSFTLSDQ
jgi:hypothetical protein